MAQSSLYPPTPEKLASPVPKRSRLSLKQNKQLLQEQSLSPVYFEAKPEPTIKCINENEDCVSTNICTEQDENASPNCSFIQLKQIPGNVSDLDTVEKIFAPGLPNCGNTCYINSILQVLRFTPNFLSSVHVISSAQTNFAQVYSSADEAIKEKEFFLKLHMLYIAMKKQEILCKNVEKDIAGSLMRPLKSFLTSLRSIYTPLLEELCVSYFINTKGNILINMKKQVNALQRFHKEENKWEISSTFEEGEQHDAHELLLTIISTFSSFLYNIKSIISGHSESKPSAMSLGNNDSVCTEEIQPSKARLKRRQKSFLLIPSEKLVLNCKNLEEIDLGFEGKIQHCIKCLECEKRLERTELFTNLEVPIADSLVFEDTVDLMQCLSQRTILYGENKYFCEECYHLNEAQMSSEVVSLPSILLLHCSWLRQSSDIGENEKDCTKVLIPLSLKTSENTEIFCSPQDESYILYAIVLHLGKSTEGGHYVSFVKDALSKNTLDNMKNLHCDGQNANLEFCCATAEILNFKLFNMTANRWLLFDDETVTGVYVNESNKIFPYFDFLGITATPCMIFYYKL